MNEKYNLDWNNNTTYTIKVFVSKIYLNTNISLWKNHNFNYAKSLAYSRYFDHSESRNKPWRYILKTETTLFCCYNFSEELHLGVSFCSHRNIAILFAIPLTFLYIPACLTHAFPLTKFEVFECLWYFFTMRPRMYRCEMF